MVVTLMTVFLAYYSCDSKRRKGSPKGKTIHSNNSVFNLHFMKVSTENDNNFGYEKITVVVDNIPLIVARVYVKIRVCLPRKYGRFMLFIDNNLLLPGARLHILNNIYRK
jgi:hypothetical protein